MWCGKVYCFLPTPDFHIADEDGRDSGAANDEGIFTSGWRPQMDDDTRYKSARNGDDLMVPFECGWCIFGKLFKRTPDISGTSDSDLFAMCCICRVVLDVFWSREPTTVRTNAALV
jgi:hypothetical protein